MAVLNRKDFFSQLQDRVGNDTSDEALSFIENMTDTFNDMEQRANAVDSENWERKYNELNESWKKKYTNRFFSGSGNSNIPTDDPDEAGNNKSPNHIKIEDLFTTK